MKPVRLPLFVGLSLLAGAGPLEAKAPPSFSKDIRPFFTKYCLECHNARKMKGGLTLETYKDLLEGSDVGPVLTAGKPDVSKIVRVLERKEEPAMSPKKSRQPRPEEVALVRAWVAAGARDDAGKLTVRIPDLKPRVRVQPAVAALAYHPDGKTLAAGGNKEVTLIDVASGEILGKVPSQPGPVTALA